MRKIVQKTSFLGGEAGPLLEGRSELAQFQFGCSRGGLRNFIALKGGGVTRRPGTRYVKNTQGDLQARLIPFISSYDNPAGQFVLEFTSSTTRAIKNSNQSVSNLAACGMSIETIQYVQSADFMFLAEASAEPKIVYRTNDIPNGITAGQALTLDDYVGFTLARATSRPEHFSMPYRTANIDTTFTMTASAATVGTGRTITASSAFFVPQHIGTYMRIFATGYVKITDVAVVGQNVPQTTATVTVLTALDSTSATSNWAEGAWSDYRGWPRSVAFYNGRLIWGGNNTQPDTFWASQVDDYFQMHSADNSAIDAPKSFTLRSDKLNQIQWMVGGKKLTIGTTSSEWVGEFREDGSNLFVEFDEETKHGSRYIQPKKLASSIPFIQRSGQTIREMNFDFNQENYVATDLNLFASHVGTIYDDEFDRTAIEDVDSVLMGVEQQNSPMDIVWSYDSSGRLYGLTRDKQQQIASWHSHGLGGGYESEVPGYVMSICVMPSPNTGNTPGVDRLWLCVLRTINGVAKYHVEYMDDFRDNRTINVTDDGFRNKSFLDCSTIQTAASTVSWSNLTRFASDSCYVIAQNASGVIVYDGIIAVNGSGQITLPTAATVVVAGLHADAVMRLLPMEGGDAPQLVMRSLKRIDTACLRLHQTWGLRIGKNRISRKTGNEESSSFEPIIFDASGLPIISTFTGIKEVQVPTDCDIDGSFSLAMQDPWPCTILSISSRVVANEV